MEDMLMRLNPKTNQQGFTLVEIAIVLVIIGLLLGAVFKGQELIGQAKVKNVVKKADEIRAASYTFLDKYNQLPGDASQVGPDDNIEITAANKIDTDATNNDGQIDNAPFWQQLREAGLLDGSGSTAAKTPFGTNYYVGYGLAGFGDNAICANVPSDIAKQIDTRYDDGDPAQGSYRSAGDGTKTPPSTTVQDYSNDTSWICTKL